jgi:hypothetical protein
MFKEKSSKGKGGDKDGWRPGQTPKTIRAFNEVAVAWLAGSSRVQLLLGFTFALLKLTTCSLFDRVFPDPLSYREYTKSEMDKCSREKDDARDIVKP